MRLTRRERWQRLRDHIFPLPEPLMPQEEEAIQSHKAEERQTWEARVAVITPERVGDAYAVCAAALEQERQRRQSIESRLTTMIGLSSIAGTIVFGTLLANTPRAGGLLDWLILACLLYLVLQIASAILAGVRGLERRPYPQPSTADLLVAVDETPAHHARCRLREFLEIFVEHQERNNEKVTQMDVAHCATKNFIAGLLVLALLATVSRLVAPPRPDLVDRLANDASFRRALAETFRGPQGPPGPPGQPCSPKLSPSQLTPKVGANPATLGPKD
ncbi:MAG: hypothetical protein HY820_25435 [Acidobacteria bacterium]|nr:hypothetical protein [Acidobacteriota bacterium]